MTSRFDVPALEDDEHQLPPKEGDDGVTIIVCLAPHRSWWAYCQNYAGIYLHELGYWKKSFHANGPSLFVAGFVSMDAFCLHQIVT